MAKNEIDFSPANPENAAAAGEQEEASAAEAAEEGGVDISVGPEEEKKPEVVTMTPEEFAALKAQGDSTRAMKEGIADLASKLNAPAPHPMPVNAPTQTPEEFYAEHSDDMFDKEKGGALMAKYTKMVSEREYGPLLRGMSTALSTTRKELLEAKDPHFKRFKGEVESLVAQQPPDVQIQPDIYERAWQTVRAKHSAEIEAESVKSQVDAAVEAKLKELGIDPKNIPAGGMRPAAHVNSEGRSTPSVSSSSRPRVRLPDAATKQKLEAEALRKGMAVEDLLRVRGYIQ
jgi:hypothetical protein